MRLDDLGMKKEKEKKWKASALWIYAKRNYLQAVNNHHII